jgi:phage gpG-like protein
VRYVKETGIGPNIEVLRDLRMRAHDQRPGWRKVGRHLRRVTAEQFTSEGVRLNRRRWKPLSPAYAVRKRADGFNGPILTRTGELRRSFRVLSIRKNRLEFGSTNEKAVWHHEGRGHNPTRRILNEGIGITRDINKILTDYIANGRV